MMMANRGTPQATEERGTAKVKHPRFFGLALRGIVLIMALCAFIYSAEGLQDDDFRHRISRVIAIAVYALASFILVVIIPEQERLPAGEGRGPVRERRLDWSLVTYYVINGVGWNWVCAFLWFSGRYGLFSAQVVGVTGVIIASYAAIAVLVSWLTGGSWRTALLLFAFVPVLPAIIVLRLHLLR